MILIAVLSNWIIRPAAARDIAAVLSLWESAGSPPSVGDTHEGLQSLLADGRAELLLADSDGVVVGSLIAAWDGWRGSFYRLAVHPRRRRQGIALALVAEGQRRLLALGADRLTAIVADDDPVAMEFWRASGFQRQSRRARFVRDLPPPT